MGPIKVMPDIKGSVDIRTLLRTVSKVDYVDAASAARAAVNNGAVLSGALGINQGYLVYTFQVMDGGNKVHDVVVDAGNGSVLYTSDGFDMGPNVPSIVGGPQIYGSPGMFGVGKVIAKYG
jgi:hypothetical protein